jgi:hypothetical protein
VHYNLIEPVIYYKNKHYIFLAGSIEMGKLHFNPLLLAKYTKPKTAYTLMPQMKD